MISQRVNCPWQHDSNPELSEKSGAVQTQALLNEVRVLEARIAQLERELSVVAADSEPCKQLMTIPGIGLLTSTAIVAATSGSVTHFTSSRHFAAWFGLTPKERSSGEQRRLGRISKMGDKYLRMLLTHGARSVLRAAGWTYVAAALTALLTFVYYLWLFFGSRR